MTAERARDIPGRAAVARRKTGRAPGEPRNVAYLYILPGLAAYLIFTFFPLLQNSARANIVCSSMCTTTISLPCENADR